MDVAHQSRLQLGTLANWFKWKSSALSVPQKLSVAALSRQFPLQDVLCVTARSASKRR